VAPDDAVYHEGMTEETLSSLAGSILEAAHNAHLGVSITLIDERPMRRIFVNQAAASVFGYTEAELLNLRWPSCATTDSCT
jgi:hypothetical protein